MDAASPTYPVGTIAKLLLLTDRRVQQLTKEGVIPKSERGRYELAPAVQGYVRYLQERTHGSTAAPADYHLEKARLVRAQADRAEVELGEIREQLVSADDVTESWAQLLVTIKTRLLGIPSKAAPILAVETNISVLRDILDEYIRDVLMELSEYGGKADSAADAANVEAQTAEQANG